jgi:hypothetical protein
MLLILLSEIIVNAFWPTGQFSVVGVLAIADAVDCDTIGGFVEQDPVVADTQTQQPFKLSRQRHNSADAGFDIAVKRLENIQSHGLRNGANLCRHAGQETDFLHVGSVFVVADLVHREAAFGGEFFE